MYTQQKCEDGPAPLPDAAVKSESVVRDISTLLELNEVLIGEPSANFPYKTTARLTVQVVYWVIVLSANSLAFVEIASQSCFSAVANAALFACNRSEWHLSSKAS